MVEYNGTVYRYVHNLQGDIFGILDSEGTLVAEYKYDAWGKPISNTGSLKTFLGELNPFRYRGYEVYRPAFGGAFSCHHFRGLTKMVYPKTLTVRHPPWYNEYRKVG